MKKKQIKEKIPAGDYDIVLRQFPNQARIDEYVAIIVNNEDERKNGKGMRMRLCV